MKRDPYFDVLKFFAMFLVVFGHAYWAFGCAVCMPYFENFRCGMNMPLFFMVSGYFAAQTIENGDWHKLGKHIYGYFWPMAFVSIVFAALAVVFRIPGSENGLVGYAGRRFLFSPWFLWCLACCYTLVFICCKPKLRVLRWGAFLLLIIVMPFAIRVWYANEVRAMLPHFIFGAFVLRRCELWKNHCIGGVCILAFLICVFLQGNILDNGLSFYHMNTTWEAFFSNGASLPLYFARIVNGIVGSIGIMWAVQLLCDKFKVVARLAPLGMMTLWVYILHQWLMDRVVGLGWYNRTILCVIMWTVLLFAFSHTFGIFARYLVERVTIWRDKAR